MGKSYLLARNHECQRDVVQGEKNLEKTCYQGCAKAGYYLGSWYIEEANYQKGINFLSRAFQMGYYHAIFKYIDAICNFIYLGQSPGGQFSLLIHSRRRLKEALDIGKESGMEPKKQEQLESIFDDCV